VNYYYLCEVLQKIKENARAFCKKKTKSLTFSTFSHILKKCQILSFF